MEGEKQESPPDAELLCGKSSLTDMLRQKGIVRGIESQNKSLVE